MCQFIESICCVNKKLRNIDFHQGRFDQTRKAYFDINPSFSLQEIIKLPSNLTHEKYKIRIIYGNTIEFITFELYQIKPVETIRLLNIDDQFDYSYKYLNRTFFNNLLKESKTDDLVLVKSNFITDCIYSNLIFFDDKQWITPKTFLLKGTMRQALLSANEIIEKDIKVSDLQSFQYFKRINAMMNFDESQTIDIKKLDY